MRSHSQSTVAAPPSSPQVNTPNGPSGPMGVKNWRHYSARFSKPNPTAATPTGRPSCDSCNSCTSDTSTPPQLNYQLPPQLQLAYVEGSPPQITSLPPRTHSLSATQHYQPRRARYYPKLHQLQQPQLRQLTNNPNVGSTSIHSREMFPNLTQQATPLQQTAECSHLCCKCSNILILVHLTGQIAN